ncbi:TonB family protein [candidate division KSB1 bacterium]|nr:TonB family protein [candidate division KSB1 bacterium]
MEEFLNNSESGATIDNDSSQELVTTLFKRHDSSENYGISKFPKEFKKNIIKSIDFRFTLIFIFSLLVHTLGIFYLEKKYPPEYDSDTISRLQKQYVDLLLTDEPPTTEFITPKPAYPQAESEPETIASISEWMETFADNTLKSIKEMPGFDPSVPKSAGRSKPETASEVEELLSKDLEDIVQENAQKESDAAEELTSVGLLGMIGSKKEKQDQEFVDDILGYADLNDDHLANVLSKLSSIQVPRHNTAEYILNQRKKAEEMQQEKVKGGRNLAEHDRIKLANNIQPLETAKTEDMERRMEFEEVPDSPLAKLRNPAADQKQRTAKSVIKVVQSHKLALQDCYKQELKINPKVRGRVIIRFTVDPEGKVVDASIVSSTLRSAAMESCLLRRIKNWKDFGYSDPAAGNVVYKQAFNFGK